MKFLQYPTPEELADALRKVNCLPGLDLADWWEHATIIPGKGPMPDGSYQMQFGVYFDVATRVLMARRWHDERGEGGTGGEQYNLVDVSINAEGSPDPDRWFVVRVELHSPYLGKAVGIATADISESGGRADKTNPIENALTSAMGRALGLDWGFGIIPGTGAVASADEVNAALDRKERATPPRGRGKPSGRRRQEGPPPDMDEAPPGMDEAPPVDEEASGLVQRMREQSIALLAEKAAVIWGEEAEQRLDKWYARRLAKAACKGGEPTAEDIEKQRESVPLLSEWPQEAVVAALNDLRRSKPDLFGEGGE